MLAKIWRITFGQKCQNVERNVRNWRPTTKTDWKIEQLCKEKLLSSNNFTTFLFRVVKFVNLFGSRAVSYGHVVKFLPICTKNNFSSNFRITPTGPSPRASSGALRAGQPSIGQGVWPFPQCHHHHHYHNEQYNHYQVFLRDPYYTKISRDQRISLVQFFGNIGGLVIWIFPTDFLTDWTLLTTWSTGWSAHRLLGSLRDGAALPPWSARICSL